MLAYSLIVISVAAAGPAQAIPSFARKYGTSCTTCHTIYPKLTPFGEAFRRNGFRFPGVDSDYAKQESVPLQPKVTGADDYGLISIPALSFGFNGQAVLHPDKKSSGGVADNGASFLLKDLVGEGHLWAGGSFSDTISYFGEVTFGSDGTIDVEHAQVFANDLIGPKHAVNVRAGRGFSTLTSFGPHASFLTDQIMPSSGATALLGGSPGWNVFDHFNGVEVTGVLLDGRFDYSAGLNAGSSFDTRNSENFYGHVGAKFGGMRLDGEGESKVKDAMRPWEEQAITVDLWIYRSVNSANFAADPADASSSELLVLDSATVVGGSVRAQLDSLDLIGGLYLESHNQANRGSGAKLLAVYGELSYMLQPWFVPALRLEYSSLSPDGGAELHNLRILPGIAAAIRPNIKLVLVADLESSNGTPPGGWGAVGGMAAPAPGATDPSVGLELESITLQAFFAF
jgi:hypothetical protein